jgi:hypothetical protein
MKKNITKEEWAKLRSPELKELIDSYSVKEIEKLAIDLYENLVGDRNSYEARYLEMLMEKRRDKLNKNFIWTNENRERIIQLNDKFYQSFKKAYNEALLVSDEMEKRSSGDFWINRDYALAIVITPECNIFYGSIRNDRKIYMILLHFQERYFGFANFHDIIKGQIIYDFEFEPDGYLNNTPEYIDKEIKKQKKSKNKRKYFRHHFNKILLNEAFSDLINGGWSYQDIVNIDSVYADVFIRRSFYEENPDTGGRTCP